MTEENRNKKIENFVRTILHTNRTPDFFINVDNINGYEQFEVELNALNTLIKKSDPLFKEKFVELISKMPTIISTFPLLLAIAKIDRQNMWKGNIQLEVIDHLLNIHKYSYQLPPKLSFRDGNLLSINNNLINTYFDLFEKTGLKYIFQNKIEKSVMDYVVGILVGLDSNGRKNRAGNFFEKICEIEINRISKEHNILVNKQTQFKKLLPNISDSLGNRKADFILSKNGKFLNIETNYFHGFGSKPEEVIESYIQRSMLLKQNNVEFILITDGNCWSNPNKNQLKRAFENLNIGNYNSLKIGEWDKFLEEYFN